MRLLFTCLPDYGHFHPLVPLARAAREAGHEVAFAAPDRLRAGVERLGLGYFPAGANWEQLRLPRVERPLTTMTHQERRGLMDSLIHAGARVERMLPDLLAVCAAWRPDVVVRDHIEFGGYLAAEELGIPHAAVEITTAGHLAARREAVRAPLNGWRTARRLPPDPDLTTLDRYLLIVPYPPSLRDPEAPLPRTARRLRPLLFDRSGDERLPDWVADLSPRPVVHATLGTIVDRSDILAAIVEGLGDLPLSLIVTCGRERDPAELRPLPANTRAAPYIPHSLLLPHCDAVIAHGGSNTLAAALAHGLPMVIFPFFGDHPTNAGRCAAVGAARVIEPDGASPTAIREATLAVLTDPSYRRRARAIRAEMVALPPVEEGVRWLEQLAAERAPLVPPARSS